MEGTDAHFIVAIVSHKFDFFFVFPSSHACLLPLKFLSFCALQELLLIELRQMNEEVSLKQKNGDHIKDLENFRKQYAIVLLQLKDVNDQACYSAQFFLFFLPFYLSRVLWVHLKIGL